MLPLIIATIDEPADQDIILEFYSEYKALMYSQAKKYLDIDEDAEDIVYEALTRIIEKMQVFRSLLPPQRIAYAVTTVRSLAIILLKKQKRYTMISLDAIEQEYPADTMESPDDIAEQRQFQSQAAKLLGQINVEDRLLLEQKYILHWTDEELAAGLGVKPQSVRMYITRAKRRLLSEIKQQGFNLLDW